MNKFTVGLPIDPKPGFIDKIVEYKDRISEVYFSWGSFPGGRACDRDCYVHLEKKGVLKKSFKEPFRKREKWHFELSDFDVIKK